MSQILIWLYEQVLLIISPRPLTSTTKENCFTKLKIRFLCILRSWFWSKFSMLIIFRYFPQKNVLWDFMSHVWGDVEAPLRFIMCFHTHARCMCVCVLCTAHMFHDHLSPWLQSLNINEMTEGVMNTCHWLNEDKPCCHWPMRTENRTEMWNAAVKAHLLSSLPHQHLTASFHSVTGQTSRFSQLQQTEREREIKSHANVYQIMKSLIKTY